MTRNCLFWFVGRRRFIKKLVTTNVTKFLLIWNEEFHALAKQFQVTYNIKSDDKIPKNNSFLYRFFCRKLWSHHKVHGCIYFYNFVMIFCEVLSGTSTWFFRLSQIFSKIPKIRGKFKKSTQPRQNYRLENAITQLISKMNTSVCRWFLLLSSTLSIFYKQPL